MKKLAILCSLALLVAPSFKGNAFTDLARNQIKMIDEGTTTSSGNPTIVFGTTVPSPDENGTTLAILNNSDFSNFDAIEKPKFSGVTKSYLQTKGNALKMGAAKSEGNVILSFNTETLVEQIIISARYYNKNSQPTITVTSNDGKNDIKSVSSKISTSSFTAIPFAGLGGDNSTESKTITIASNKYVWISQIEFVMATSTTATVTYEYGNSNDNEDFDKIPSVEVTKGETTNSPLADGYTYSDWDGTRELVGWYTDEAKTEAFDFSTTITKDITLYAKWKITADSTDVTNLKSSETKSQLYYEYSNKAYVETTESVTFGTNKTSSGTKFSEISNYTPSDGAGIETITGNEYVYQDDAESDVKMSNSSNNGTLTFNFKTETIVEKVIVYAIAYKSSEKSTLKVSSSNLKTTTAQTIKYAASHESDTPYTFTGFDGTDEFNKLSSTSITLSATNRLYVSKVEFVIAKEETSPDTYSITNIGLRFGGLVKQSYFDNLKDHITNFGLIYATDLGDHKTLEDALNDESVKKTELDQEITSEVTPYLTTVDGESYYVFNAFFNVKSTSVTNVVYAIATLTLDNGETIYFKEESNSVATIAQVYLGTNKYDGAVKETLKLLSQGKTKTTDTTESN